MGLSSEQLRASLDALGQVDPRLGRALATHGYPEPRIRARGYPTMLRTIVGQQISVTAAASIWARLEGALPDINNPADLLAAGEDSLRGAGLSRSKVAYARDLAERVVSGTVDFAALDPDDEAAIAQLVAIKGIGRWSAEIYLLFAEGRSDIWPAGDLAVQIAVGRIVGLDARPSEREVRALAEGWRPHRGAAAIFAWHSYKSATL